MSLPDTYGAQETKVYYVAESSYGLLPTSPSMLGINVEEHDPSIDPGLLKIYGVGSRDLQALYPGIRKVKLKLKHVPSPLAPITLTQYAGLLSSLSVQVVYFKGQWASPTNINSLILLGCKVDKLTATAKTDDVLKADVDLVGQNASAGTALISGATYGDYPGGIPFYDTPVQLGSASGGGLSSLTDCTDWQFEIKNNLKPVPVIQSAGSASLLHKFLRERNRELTGEVTLEFQSPWALTALLANQQFSLNFLLGGGHQALFTYCMWEEFPPATKVKDLVSVKLKWIAETAAIT